MRGQPLTISDDQLNAALAERVMGWVVCPDRYGTGNRSWLPRWKFRPTEKLDDAFRLLDAADSTEYTVRGTAQGAIHVSVKIDGVVSEATGRSAARTITLAIAKAVSIRTEELSGD